MCSMSESEETESDDSHHECDEVTERELFGLLKESTRTAQASAMTAQRSVEAVTKLSRPKKETQEKSWSFISDEGI